MSGPRSSPTVRRVRLWIGTSGWQYRHWRTRFYERGLPTDRWFEHYAETFHTVELNVTFYRQPRPAVFEGWARRAPEGFLFAVKASRFLTHIKRLRDPRDSVEILMAGADRLGSHLGPILLQLPPDMAAEPERLAETLAAFPAGVRIAVEPRNPSWFEPAAGVEAVLRSAGAALCWADRRRPVTPLWATADWGYVRFHGGRARPASCYGEEALATWVDRVADAPFPPRAAVFAYFNNDHAGCALRDAGVFARLAAARDVATTSTRDAAAIPVG
jgi:uncharacterized protein YecE (DUF72 family)